MPEISQLCLHDLLISLICFQRLFQSLLEHVHFILQSGCLILLHCTGNERLAYANAPARIKRLGLLAHSP